MKPARAVLAAVAAIGGYHAESALAEPEEAKAQFFTRAESFNYSAANPVTAYINFLIGPAPDDGEHALSRNIAEIGLSYKGLEFSLIHRNDYNLDFTQGASEFAYLNKNRILVPLDKVYDVDVWANQYQVTGMRLGYTWSMSDNFDFRMGYAQLYATESVSGYLGKNPDGSGGYISVVEQEIGGQTRRMLDGDLYADYFYTDDPLFEREVDAPTGQGYAIDLAFRWQLTEYFAVEGIFDDVLGELRWNDLPHTIADATSETIVVDEDGFLQAYPNFSGIETEDDFKQDLTERERFLVHYQRPSLYLGYEFDHFHVQAFHWFKMGYRWQSNWGLKFALEAETAAAEIGLYTPIGEFDLTFDDVDIDRAHTLGLNWDVKFDL